MLAPSPRKTSAGENSASESSQAWADILKTQSTWLCSASHDITVSHQLAPKLFPFWHSHFQQRNGDRDVFDQMAFSRHSHVFLFDPQGILHQKASQNTSPPLQSFSF